MVGYGTDEFPAFYLRSSGLPVAARVDSPAEAAAPARRPLGAWTAPASSWLNRCRPRSALDPDAFAAALARAERLAHAAGVRGPARTPFLLARLAEITEGATLRANRALIVANARLAARVAVALVEEAVTCALWPSATSTAV